MALSAAPSCPPMLIHAYKNMEIFQEGWTHPATGTKSIFLRDKDSKGCRAANPSRGCCQLHQYPTSQSKSMESSFSEGTWVSWRGLRKLGHQGHCLSLECSSGMADEWHWGRILELFQLSSSQSPPFSLASVNGFSQMSQVLIWELDSQILVPSRQLMN